jgi:20S proteasome subunit alpha 5
MKYDAKAIGSGSEAAQSELQDKWHKVGFSRLSRDIHYLMVVSIHQQMTLREAEILTLRVLKQVMEEKLDQHNVQVAQVRDRLSAYVVWYRPLMTNLNLIGDTTEWLRDT